jgi:hypothetical protein
MSSYILNEVETSHQMIRLYFILTILITEDVSRRGRMIVEFATTCAIVAYHHY